MSTTRKSTRVWIAKSAAAGAAAALVLAPFAALAPDLRSLGEVGPFAEAASFVNTTVPSNANLASGLQLFYSFDNTKVSGTSITDESGNGKNGTLYSSSASVASTSVYSSGSNSITVPTGATTLYAKMWGAGGGGGSSTFGAGGNGGASNTNGSSASANTGAGGGGAGGGNGGGGSGGAGGSGIVIVEWFE